jgi:glutamate--cysteine ligase
MLVNSQVTPQLNTTITEPLHLLLQGLLGRCKSIESWFQTQWKLSSPPVYGSVDLRNAGFKLAPIDMNLFPAGFNNLNPNYFSMSVNAARKIIEDLAPGAKKILVIPESHTRNLFYWANVRTLQRILEDAGFQVQFAIMSDEVQATMDIDLPSGEKVVVHPLQRYDGKLSVEGFSPDLILLNNDLSEGIPEILQNLDQQIIPPAELGWSQRLKSGHFQYYAEVADEFAREFNLDPWLLSPLFRHCGQIDFMQQEGLECLVANAESLFEEIKKKYAEYKIPYQPFLIVKADAGTYGMAVMTVRNIDELKTMNRKQRTRMATTKGGQTVNRVIIQEGVYTFETIGQEQAVAEPVVYLWGSHVVGGFYRVHQDRGVDENLNSPGMRFEPIAFPQPCDKPCNKSEPTACQNRLYLYGIVAQLSMLAAAREIKDQVK